MKQQTKPNKQSSKFIDKARELGVDEDEAAFDEKLAAIAGQKPKPKKDEAGICRHMEKRQ